MNDCDSISYLTLVYVICVWAKIELSPEPQKTRLKMLSLPSLSVGILHATAMDYFEVHKVIDADLIIKLINFLV